jgi:hypothetical protein
MALFSQSMYAALSNELAWLNTRLLQLLVVTIPEASGWTVGIFYSDGNKSQSMIP